MKKITLPKGICPECGEKELKQRTFKQYQTFVKGEATVVKDAQLEECNSCGKRIFSAKEVKRWENDFIKERNKAINKIYCCPHCEKEINKVNIKVNSILFYEGNVSIGDVLKSENDDIDENYFITNDLLGTDGMDTLEENVFCPLCKCEINSVEEIKEILKD